MNPTVRGGSQTLPSDDGTLEGAAHQMLLLPSVTKLGGSTEFRSVTWQAPISQLIAAVCPGPDQPQAPPRVSCHHPTARCSPSPPSRCRVPCLDVVPFDLCKLTCLVCRPFPSPASSLLPLPRRLILEDAITQAQYTRLLPEGSTTSQDRRRPNPSPASPPDSTLPISNTSRPPPVRSWVASSRPRGSTEHRYLLHSS